MNLYLEYAETKSGATPGLFMTTPGLDFGVTVGSGPIRALRAVQASDLAVFHYGIPSLYLVTGNEVYNGFAGFVFGGPVGSIATSSGPAYLIDNSQQVAVFDQTGAWLVAGTTTPIVLPFGTPGTPIYQDGFVLVNVVGTNAIYQSNALDLTTWDPLNFALSQGDSDLIVALGQLHQQMIVLKQYEAEFWINAGTAGFAFQRLQGVTLQKGCIAPQSVATTDDAIFWLGQERSGASNVVYMMGGYEGEEISTAALSTEWSTYPTTADATAYTQMIGGHHYYVITFPSAPNGGTTWAFDIKASKMAKSPIWHERAYFSNGAFSRELACCFANFAGVPVAGDYRNGNLYTVNPTGSLDNGQPRKWVRSWRARPKPQLEAVRYNFLELNMQTGIGVPDGTNPQIVLRWYDTAQNWSQPRIMPAGQVGETGIWVRANRLGMCRRGLANDRVFEVSSTDIFGVALLGASVG